MTQFRLGPLLRHIRRLTTPSPTSDRQLLQRFADARDQGAFATLVERHGGMVLGVCRRSLHDDAEAEDVFQATFLVLAKKAAAIGNPDALAGWLYGVALRLARKARVEAARRAARQPREVSMAQADPSAEAVTRELRQVLDEELGRLPARFRNPLVLCYLEGMSRAEVARQLDWSEGAVKDKLERGRALLRDRLTRRGLAVSTAIVVTLLEQSASAQVPAAWVTSTAAAAALFAADELPAGTASALAGELLSTLAAARVRTMGVLVLAVSFAVAGAGVVTHWALAGGSQDAGVAAAVQPRETGAAGLDLHDDPRPPAPIARMGTRRWRFDHELLNLAFSPDGKTLAASPRNQSTRGLLSFGLWDVATGKLLWRSDAHRVCADATICFSPDGGTIALCSGMNGTVVLFAAATGKVMRALGRAGYWVGSDRPIAFSRDSKSLAAHLTERKFVGAKSATVFWDVATGQEIPKIAEFAQPPQRKDMSPDGKVLARCAGHSICLLDAATGKELLPDDGHRDAVRALAFAPDGQTLVSASENMRLWDPATGKQLNCFNLKVVGFAAACKLAAARLPDGIFHQACEVTTGRLIGRPLGRPFAGELAPEMAAVSPDGKVLATAGSGAVRLWEVATGKQLYAWEAPAPTAETGFVRDLAFSADGSALAANSRRGLHVYDVSTGKERYLLLERQQFEVAARESVANFALSADATTLVAISESSESPDKVVWTIKVYDLATGRFRQQWQSDVGRPFHGGAALALSPDSKTLATAQCDGTVRWWDMVTGEAIRVFTGQGQVTALAYSPDGKTLAAASDDTTILIWDLFRFGGQRPAAEFAPGDLQTLWDQLDSGTSPRCYRAMASMIDSPRQSLPFLRDRVQPVAAPTPERLQQLIGDLESDQFAVRQKATQQLEQLGELAEPALRGVLSSQPPLETQQRVDALLKKSASWSGERLRLWRVIQILEGIGTPEAHAVLKTLAGGAPASRLTEEAKASLNRLAKRAESAR